METVIALVVFIMCVAVASSPCLISILWLISEAIEGDDRARIVLGGLALCLVIFGFGWSTDVIWGAS